MSLCALLFLSVPFSITVCVSLSVLPFLFVPFLLYCLSLVHYCFCLSLSTLLFVSGTLLLLLVPFYIPVRLFHTLLFVFFSLSSLLINVCPFLHHCLCVSLSILLCVSFLLYCLSVPVNTSVCLSLSTLLFCFFSTLLFVCPCLHFCDCKCLLSIYTVLFVPKTVYYCLSLYQFLSNSNCIKLRLYLSATSSTVLPCHCVCQSPLIVSVFVSVSVCFPRLCDCVSVLF